MSTKQRPDDQTTIDPWLDGGPLYAEDETAWAGVAPKQGWDNACDVREGKQLCRDLHGVARRTKKDLPEVFALAGRLRQFGISERLAADLIWTFNQPPFEKVEVVHETHEAYRLATNPPGLLSQAGRPENDWTPTEADDLDDVSWLEGGAPVWPRPMHYDAKQHNSKLAESLLADRPAKLIFSDGTFYTLEDGKVWRELPDTELAAEIRQTDPALVLDTPRIWGIVSAVKLMAFTKARPFEWIDEPHDAPLANDLILFRNGLFDFATGELAPHTGRYFATGLPDFDHDPAATCPLWREKLGEWLHPSFHPTLQEFVGYMLTPDTRIETLLAMIGATRGGKGTIAFVMQSLVGPDHHCSRTMNDLAGEFGLEGVTDKRVMFIPDAHNTELSRRSAALERIKSITGNDVLSVNRKNKGIINARIPAKLVLVANQHPKFLDESGALAARELLLIFRNSFRGKEDRELRSKLAAELPGIANWAMEGLRRLRDSGGKFTIGAEGKAASRELAESQSPALRFARDCLIVTGDPDDFEGLPEVYERYEQWASFVESLGSREKRNRDDFKSDLVAALTSRGVVYERRRWHDPSKPETRRAARVRGFFGFKLKAE
jgi:P4 family phage/plasmid primase-like protien